MIPPKHDEILRLPEVKRQTGLSASSIYALIAQDAFPGPVRLSERRRGWLASEIQNWIADRVVERDQLLARAKLKKSQIAVRRGEMSNDDVFEAIASASRDYLSKLELETSVEALAADIARDWMETAWEEFRDRELPHLMSEGLEYEMITSCLKALFYAGHARQASVLAEYESSSAYEALRTFAGYRLAVGHLDNAQSPAESRE